ncbi:hypothetical protein, partial [Sansalvadorimonas verongulae]|uniref:hypothetical protein n=1 Tax=Sansalvadorimonas verongulae TaxID=2172824 RepID=UPI001E2DDF5F
SAVSNFTFIYLIFKAMVILGLYRASKDYRGPTHWRVAGYFYSVVGALWWVYVFALCLMSKIGSLAGIP